MLDDVKYAVCFKDSVDSSIGELKAFTGSLSLRNFLIKNSNWKEKVY